MKLTTNEKEKAILTLETYINNLNAPTIKKDIIDGTLNNFGFTTRQKNSKSPNSKFNAIRSFIGNTLTDKITNNELVKIDENKYFTSLMPPKNITKPMCLEAILECLKENKTLTKKVLVDKTIEKLGVKESYYQKEANVAKSFIGQILQELAKEKKLLVNKDKYTLYIPPVEKEKADDNQPLDEVKFKKAFIAKLNEKGGAFFENFASNLLEKYFMITGNEIEDCKVVGGTKDGGIDVKIDIVDPLGFHERILVQAKCRKNIKVTEKEVREFYGAIHTELSATSINKGIIITTSTFHMAATQLINTLGNCIGIDEHMLFELAKKTAYGIRKNSNGYLFDETIFK